MDLKPRDQQQELERRWITAETSSCPARWQKLGETQPQGESEIEWWVWLPRPNSNLRASPASWRRCSGPIDEASSGEIRLDDDVLGLDGSVV